MPMPGNFEIRFCYVWKIQVNCRKGANRVLRGGSWNNNPQNCRVANRNNNGPANRNNNVGFRLALQLTGMPDGFH